MFRYFRLKAGRVELGQPLPPALHDAAKSAIDGALVLPSESFGGAERITLFLSPGGLVTGATFDYGPTVHFETRVKDYSAMGAPARETTDDGAESVRWEDDATSFTLRRAPNGEMPRITAELRDRSPGTQ